MSLRTPRGDWFSTKAAALLAAVSGGVAIWLSLRPERLADLYRLIGWTSRWLSGDSLYSGDSDVDYPPWAIVVLSPLSLVPSSIVAPLWVACNVALLIFVARTLSRQTSLLTPSDDASRVALMFLLIAAGAMRTLNQFTLLSLALAVAGSSGDTRLRPVWLGLSLFKPQIGGVFWLHAVWKRQWRVAAVAAVVPLLLSIVYAWRAGVAPSSLPGDYARALAVQYGDALTGQTELTIWLQGLLPGVPGAMLAVGVALVIFATLAATQPLLGLSLASLLSVRHLSYDLVLLLPWLSGQPRRVVWGIALLMVADPSALAGVWRADGWFTLHADRLVLMLGWMGAIWWTWRASVATESDTIGHN